MGAPHFEDKGLLLGLAGFKESPFAMKPSTVCGEVRFRPRCFVHPDKSPDRRPGGSYSDAMTLIQYDNDDVPAVSLLEEVLPGGIGQVQGTAIL